MTGFIDIVLIKMPKYQKFSPSPTPVGKGHPSHIPESLCTSNEYIDVINAMHLITGSMVVPAVINDFLRRACRQDPLLNFDAK